MNIGGWVPDVPKPKKKATGPFKTWTEQQWVEHGFRTVKIRAPLSVADHFDALAKMLGVPRAEALAALLDGIDTTPEPHVPRSLVIVPVS